MSAQFSSAGGLKNKNCISSVSGYAAGIRLNTVVFRVNFDRPERSGADLRTDEIRKARYEVSKSKAQRTTVPSDKQIQDSGCKIYSKNLQCF